MNFIYLCEHVEARGQPWASGASQLCFLETKSLPELELMNESKLAGHQAQGSASFHFPCAGITIGCHRAQMFI